MLRHGNSRWLSLRPVLTRVFEQWNNLEQYFIKFLPKQKDQKNALETARYIRIKKVFSESTYSKICICFAMYIASILEDIILKPFQSSAPTVHLLYPAMSKLLFVLMSNFIKKDQLQRADAFLLSKIDVTKDALTIGQIHYGTGVERLLSESKSGADKNAKIAIEKLKT